MAEQDPRLAYLLEAAAAAERRRSALTLCRASRAGISARRLTREEQGDIEAAEIACRLAHAAVARWRARRAAELEVAAERALRAPLNPEEEIALLRVASGMAVRSNLTKPYLDRLTALELVDAGGPALVLTALGARRVAQLPSNSFP